jgi:D-alanine-D-alanine ligase-like ATP-grasp enzyme
VNHRLFRALSVFDEVLAKTLGRLSAVLNSPHEQAVAHTLYGWLTSLFHAFGLVTFNTDPSRAASGRSELVWHEANRRGIRMEQLVFRGKHLEQYRAQVDDRWFYFDSIPVPPRLMREDTSWIDDKLLLAKRLHEHGLPTPHARCVTSWGDAEEAFHTMTKPVIVKPRRGSRGRHTTTRIGTLAELRTAYDLAQEIARELVIEEHLFGSVCRATVVGGKLVGFFRADPPQVTGDGVHTIGELIAQKNASRHERLGEVVITDDLISFIRRAGYTLEGVLPHGVVLDLSAKTGRFYGGSTEEMLTNVHPKMHEIFTKAAGIIGAPVAGFDLISADPTQDPDTERWGIIECNSLPFIDLHYYALRGEPVDVARHIWDLWNESE